MRSDSIHLTVYLIVTAFVCFFHYASPAQSTRNTTLSAADSTKAKLIDSARISPIIPRVTTPDSIKPVKKGFEPQKTPMLALGLSVVLPGAGQIYDESYWKAPVIWGLGGYWVYEYISNNSKYKDYQNQYLQSLVEIPGYGNGNYKRLRDFYRDERDKFGWYIGVLYIANILDAYIAAHLYDFDVTPDIGEQGQVSVKLKLRL